MLLALFLVTWANASPVIASLLLGSRWSRPLDAGRRFIDGRPWLGPSKTWRGWLACILTTPALGVLFDLPWSLGLALAIAAMLGDTSSSFIKRRLALPASSSAPMLDQLPEALLPALVLKSHLGLSPSELAVIIIAFMLIDLALTPVADGIRRWLR